MSRITVWMCLVVMAGAGVWVRAVEPQYEQGPIGYSKAEPADAVARLKKSDAAVGGGLEGLLKALDVPVSSQTLVFSKTSLQRNRISPGTPRAIYFNDDTYVGFVPGSSVVEIAATDGRIGTTFYTADLKASPMRFVRQTDNCLTCHGGSMTRDVPGLMVRSVFPDGRGDPILPAGTFVTTHASPVSQRWGGWYVTGLAGAHAGMANTRYDDKEPVKPVAFPVIEPEKDVDLSRYPVGTSDAVALLVLGHQAEGHNRITRASYAAQFALRDERVMRELEGTPVDALPHREATVRRVKSGCEPLVEYLLFAGEAKVSGVSREGSGFAAEFEGRGKKDGKGRSLRELDLVGGRLLKYPCSWLIYTEGFEAMPEVAKEYVYRRLWEVLTGEDRSKAFAHLSAGDRGAILEILRETKGGLPGYWK